MKQIEINWSDMPVMWKVALGRHYPTGTELTEDELNLIDAMSKVSLPRLSYLNDALKWLVQDSLDTEIDWHKRYKELRETVKDINEFIEYHPELNLDALEAELDSIENQANEIHEVVSKVRHELCEQGYSKSVYNLLYD